MTEWRDVTNIASEQTGLPEGMEFVFFWRVQDWCSSETAVWHHDVYAFLKNV